MKLYVCWGTFQTFGPGHPCRNALDALHAAGHDPEIIHSHGWGLVPGALTRSEGRRLARRATGKSWIPLLLTDDGELIVGSTHIKEWAHPSAGAELNSAVGQQADRTLKCAVLRPAANTSLATAVGVLPTAAEQLQQRPHGQSSIPRG